MLPSVSARSHSFAEMAVTALAQTVAKWRATSLRAQDPLPAVGGMSSRIETDLMRSATAIVADVVGVAGVTLRESGLVEVR